MGCIHTGRSRAEVNMRMTLHTNVVENLVLVGIEPSLIRILVGIDRRAGNNLWINQNVGDVELVLFFFVTVCDTVPSNLAGEILNQHGHLSKCDGGEHNGSPVLTIPFEVLGVIELTIEHLHLFDILDKLLLNRSNQLVGELDRLTHVLPPFSFVFPHPVPPTTSLHPEALR